MKDNIIFPCGIDNTLHNSWRAPGCQQTRSLLLRGATETGRKGARMQPRLGDQGNPPLHLPALGWSLARLEPSCLCREEFGWGRNGRSRCREQIPVGNDAETSSALLYLNILTHLPPPEKCRQCLALILRRFCSAGTKEQDPCPLSPPAPSAPHPQIFQCWEVPRQPVLLLFFPSSLSWV